MLATVREPGTRYTPRRRRWFLSLFCSGTGSSYCSTPFMAIAPKCSSRRQRAALAALRFPLPVATRCPHGTQSGSCPRARPVRLCPPRLSSRARVGRSSRQFASKRFRRAQRSEEHTSELQSLAYLVCRLLLEKKKKKKKYIQQLENTKYCRKYTH